MYIIFNLPCFTFEYHQCLLFIILRHIISAGQVIVLVIVNCSRALVPPINLIGSGQHLPSMHSLPSRPIPPRMLAERHWPPSRPLIGVSLYVLCLLFNKKKQVKVCDWYSSRYINLFYLLLQKYHFNPNLCSYTIII